MPKSKREKIVSLTKTKKRSTTLRKAELMDEIRESIDKYRYVYVFDLANSRSQHMKEMRSELSDSRIFMTKNKVMQKALGLTTEDEYAPNLHQVSKELIGICGLLLTNRTKQEVTQIFSKFQVKDYARSGHVVDQTIVLPAGPIEFLAHSMEEVLVTLGLPVELKNGQLTLRYEHTVCKMGDTLAPEQAKILKHYQMPLATFTVVLKCGWDKETRAFEKW
jgi:mRNA turnover protein 4